jgi:hypothetical protein
MSNLFMPEIEILSDFRRGPVPETRKLRHNGWMGNSALVMGSLTIALILVELELRITGFSFPSFYKADEITAHSFRLNAEGWFREEGEAYIKINSDGWRDRFHKKEKPLGVRRIAVLGDSFASAFHVAAENTFWSVMERESNRCGAFGPQTIEAINFGVTGYGTVQELLTLKYRVWEYSPDLVILTFLTGNDLTDNFKPLAGAYPRPYVSRDKDGQLTIDQSFVHSRTYQMKTGWAWKAFLTASDYLRIFQLLNKAQTRLKDPELFHTAQIYKAYGNHGKYIQEPGLDDKNVYATPASVEWEDAWRVTEELIIAVRNEVEAHGARFMLVTLSNGIQVHPDAHIRKQFMEGLGVYDLFYPEKRLKELADREHFELLTLAPKLQSYADEHHIFLHGFPNTYLGLGHWNEKGHRVAGHIIADRLCSISST